jgi:hypothetical protein
MSFAQIESTPFFPPFFEFRKNRFQILADIFAACHSIWKGDSPNSPSIRVGRTNFLKIGFVRNLPDQSGPAVVGRDNEGVAFPASSIPKSVFFPIHGATACTVGLVAQG